jgi:hypothetical protein
MNLYFVSLLEKRGKRESMIKKQELDYKFYVLPNGKDHGYQGHYFYPSYYRNGERIWCKGIENISFPKKNIDVQINGSDGETYLMSVTFKDEDIWFQIDSHYCFSTPRFGKSIKFFQFLSIS